MSESATETKKIDPYTRLKMEKDAEIEQLKAQLAQLQNAPATTPLQPGAVAEGEDTWAEPVRFFYEVWTGRSKEVREEVLPKREALDKLVKAYYDRQPIDRNILRFDGVGQRINDAPCYVRITKRNRQTGAEISVIKDLALWAVADEICNRRERRVELVSKQEYEQFYAERAKHEQDWAKPILEAKKAKAIEALTSQ